MSKKTAYLVTYIKQTDSGTETRNTKCEFDHEFPTVDEINRFINENDAVITFMQRLHKDFIEL